MERKFCTNCGKELEITAKFCNACGKFQEVASPILTTAVEPKNDVQPPIPTNQPPIPTVQPPIPTDQPPIPTDQPPIPTVEPYIPVVQQQAPNIQPQTTVKKQSKPVQKVQPKKKNTKKWVILSISLVLVLALAVSALIILPKYFSAEAKIFRAFENTLESGSFSYEVVYESFYSDGDYRRSKESGAVVIDFDNREISEFYETEYENGEFRQVLLYDGIKYYISDDYAYVRNNKSDELDPFFDYYDDNGADVTDINWDSIYDIMDEYGIYDDFKEFVDEEEFEDAVEEAISNKLPEIKENNSVYTLKIDGDYLLDLLETFEDSFRNRRDYRELEEEFEKMKDKKIEYKIVITLADEYISKVKYEYSREGELRERIEFKLSGIGKTQMDESEMEYFIRNCQEAAKNYK